MPTLRSKRKTATKAAEADATPAVEAKKSKAAEADAAPAVGTKKSKALAIGDNVSALDVELLTEEEETVKLADLVEDKGAVIFMYPKANTSGCTKQACSFGENYTAITALGFDVYGLSFDKPKSQKNWQEKYSLPYHLLTDSDGTVRCNPPTLSASHEFVACPPEDSLPPP